MASDYPKSPDQKDLWSLVSKERIGQPGLKSLLNKRPNVSEVIAWLRQEPDDVRGVCQIEILQAANNMATEGMETMSEVWDYIKNDTAWKKVKVAGEYIKNLDDEFAELAGLANLGKGFRDRKGQMWWKIISLYPEFEHDDAITRACTSQSALQAFSKLCTGAKAQKMSALVIAQQVSIAFIYRMRRIGTAANRGHSNVNLLTPEDYKAAVAKPWGSDVPKILTNEECKRFHVTLVGRLYVPTNTRDGIARDQIPAPSGQPLPPKGDKRLIIDIPAVSGSGSRGPASPQQGSCTPPPQITETQGVLTPENIRQTIEKLSDQMKRTSVGTQSSGLPRSSSLSLLPAGGTQQSSSSYDPQSGGSGTSGPPTPTPQALPALNVTTCGTTTKPCKNVTQQFIQELDQNKSATNTQGRISLLQSFKRGVLKAPNALPPNVCHRHARKFGGDIGLKVKTKAIHGQS